MVQQLPQEEPKLEDGRQRFRSTIQFPYADLNDAVAIAKAVYEHVGTGRCTPDQLAAWINHKSTTGGAFQVKTATGRIFGLIEIGRDSIQLTELGREVVDPNRAAAARVRAFLTVPLYKAVYEKFRGQTLPSLVALEHQLVELGVSPKQKDKARQALLRSAEQAGLFAQGKDRLVLPVESPAPKEPPRTGGAGTLPPAEKPNGPNGPGGGGNGEGPKGLAPEIADYLNELPESGSVWPEAARDMWLRLLGRALGRIYKDE